MTREREGTALRAATVQPSFADRPLQRRVLRLPRHYFISFRQREPRPSGNPRKALEPDSCENVKGRPSGHLALTSANTVGSESESAHLSIALPTHPMSRQSPRGSGPMHCANLSQNLPVSETAKFGRSHEYPGTSSSLVWSFATCPTSALPSSKDHVPIRFGSHSITRQSPPRASGQVD